MDPDTRQPDPSARLRLVDVRLNGGRGVAHLGGRLTGVFATSESRSDAARWIAATLAGPRPPEAEASVEIGGEIVSVASLPPLLLAPGESAVIDLDAIGRQWQEWCARRRDELAAAHASCRLEIYRLDAAVERAVSQAPVAVEEPEPAAVAEPELPAFASADVPSPDGPIEDDTPFQAQVRFLLSELESLPSERLPEGMLLADAWEAQAALVRVRAAVDGVPEIDIDALEARVNAARAVVATSEGRLPDEVRVHIEQCHALIVDAEKKLFEARRRHRSRAIEMYEQAVTSELLALADAGLDSYASFLLAIEAQDNGPDAAARHAAQVELAAARAALDDALQVPDVPTRAELDERDALIRTRAAELLGHEPDANAAAELRALRAESEGRAEKLAEIGEVLREGGVEVGDDVLGHARAILAPVQSEAPSLPPPPAAPIPAPPPGPVGASLDVDELEEQRSAQRRALEKLERELASLDAVYDTEVARLGAQDVATVLDRLLASYRAGDLLAGRIPLVLDGVLDAFGTEIREAAMMKLAEAVDVQTILVSDDPEMMQSVANAGGVLARWPESTATVE